MYFPVKPPGESDGTSNTSSPRYDTRMFYQFWSNNNTHIFLSIDCGQSDAAQPAPEAGTWFQSYFETLVQNANPAL